jgi:hypothetical protein
MCCRPTAGFQKSGLRQKRNSHPGASSLSLCRWPDHNLSNIDVCGLRDCECDGLSYSEGRDRHGFHARFSLHSHRGVRHRRRQFGVDITRRDARHSEVRSSFLAQCIRFYTVEIAYIFATMSLNENENMASLSDLRP